MSRAVQKSKFEPNHEALTGGEFYNISAENPEEIRAIQAYALENPATFAVDYDFEPAVSVDVRGPIRSEAEYNRLLGGGKEPIDEDSRAIITSSMDCFQEFKNTIFDELQEYWSSDEYQIILPSRQFDDMPSKDIFLDNGSPIGDQPKVVRTAASMKGEQAYGAIWREQRPNRELYQLMEKDGISQHEWEKSAEPLDEEVGQEFWTSITENADKVEIDYILDSSNPEDFQFDSKNQDSPWCATDIGRETTNKRTPGWNIGLVDRR